MPTGDCIVVGKIGAPYGVRGWVHIKSFTSPPENLIAYRPWLLDAGKGEWRPTSVAACRAHKSGFVAKFDGLDDRDAAASLGGTMVGVARDVLPAAAPDEFYWRDVEGCDVLDLEGEMLGKVAGFMETGAHDVMVVRSADGVEHLVPFVAQYVTAVDLQAHRVVVDWQADW